MITPPRRSSDLGYDSDYIRKLVDDAPPLGDEQRARLGRILRPHLTGKVGFSGSEADPDHRPTKITDSLGQELKVEGGDLVLASSRDASVWDRPNTRSRKRVHVAVNVVDLPAVGVVPAEKLGEAACDPMRMPLDMSVGGLAEDVPDERRCRRPGCAARWPAYKPRSRS